MNIKMTTHNYQQLNLKNKNKANNQNRNRIISVSSRLLSAGRWKGEDGGKGRRNKKHNWQVQNRWGDVKRSVGNGEAKELI